LAVSNDNDRLTGPGEPKVPSRDFLDGRGVVLEPPAFLLQLSVLDAQARYCRAQGRGFLMRANRSQVPVFSDERVHELDTERDRQRPRRTSSSAVAQVFVRQQPSRPWGHHAGRARRRSIEVGHRGRIFLSGFRSLYKRK
jgi:hypothetical protein